MRSKSIKTCCYVKKENTTFQKQGKKKIPIFFSFFLLPLKSILNNFKAILGAKTYSFLMHRVKQKSDYILVFVWCFHVCLFGFPFSCCWCSVLLVGVSFSFVRFCWKHRGWSLKATANETSTFFIF